MQHPTLILHLSQKYHLVGVYVYQTLRPSLLHMTSSSPRSCHVLLHGRPPAAAPGFILRRVVLPDITSPNAHAQAHGVQRSGMATLLSLLSVATLSKCISARESGVGGSGDGDMRHKMKLGQYLAIPSRLLGRPRGSGDAERGADVVDVLAGLHSHRIEGRPALEYNLVV